MAKNIHCALLMIFLAIVATQVSCQNITKVLRAFPQFSTFNKLLSETGVADEINTRKSVTLLAPDNSVLNPIIAKLGPTISTQQLQYILDYHVMLQYFDIPELHQIVNGTMQVTTLYQTTGTAEGTLGFVNITRTKGGSLVVSNANDSSHATIVKSVKQIPYNYSIFEISSVIVPEGVLSQTPQPVAAPVPVPAAVPVPASAPSPLSPVPMVSPVPAPVSEPAATPTPSPEAAPVPTPSVVPVTAPISSPPAPPGGGPSTAETPASPKSSAFCTAISLEFIRLGVFLGTTLPFLLQI